MLTARRPHLPEEWAREHGDRACGWYGSVEGTPDADVRKSFELNFFSVVEVLRAVLPGMRARRSGWVVTMSSVAALGSPTGFGYYGASKAAVENLTGALRSEVEPLGIKVLAVEPGAFRTSAYAGFADEPIVETVDAYLPLIESVRALFVGRDGRQEGDPYRGVRAVVAAMDAENPPHRLVLGGQGYDTAVGTLQGMLTELRAHEPASRGADFPPGE
ncbi:SDR family NAD(P)-dependent oxidoreductase [Streptomyces sp. NBC_01190]|uniref:SDR family NAD(P)-dependent oxidoreductase n=1 Tax=Streptomyces sp. NBC_01190 TaxID=2903767 RepID=UPI00386E7592|nr:SDR family NAD(P)-dependent oxidoreductase [Streptomyces sp. NBC_01190]